MGFWFVVVGLFFFFWGGRRHSTKYDTDFQGVIFKAIPILCMSMRTGPLPTERKVDFFELYKDSMDLQHFIVFPDLHRRSLCMPLKRFNELTVLSRFICLKK